MKNISFWKSDLGDYDYVLLFQADTVLCEQNRFKNGEYIATLFDYDYIGAPWLDAGMMESKGRKLHPKRPRISMRLFARPYFAKAIYSCRKWRLVETEGQWSA